MAVTQFPNGVTSFGVPIIGGGAVIPSTTGKYFFVDSTTGSNGNSGLDKDHPVATLAYAISLTTANKGDVIIVMPGHSETVSATITPVAGNQIVGLGRGRNRPVFTASTGAIDTFTISANNVTIQNIVVVGSASGCTALIEISGTYPSFIGVELQGAAAPTTLVTVSNNADGAVWSGCRFRAANGTVLGISIETTAIAPDWLMENCYCHGSAVRDIDTAFIQMSKKSLTGLIINGLIVVGIVGGQTVFDFNSSTGATADGLIVGVHVAADAAATPANIMDEGGMNTSQCFFVDGVGATGARFPATTAS